MALELLRLELGHREHALGLGERIHVALDKADLHVRHLGKVHGLGLVVCSVVARGVSVTRWVMVVVA